jgi:hypothetical protein
MDTLTRRNLLEYAVGAFALVLAGPSPSRGQTVAPLSITVYKSPT